MTVSSDFAALVRRVIEDSHRTEPLPRSEFDRATADRAALFSMLQCPDSIRLGRAKRGRTND